MDKSSITAREWHVRKALPEDLPMIAEIEKLSFHRPWSFDSIESFYYRKTSDIYVWRDRNRISGYIIAEHVLDQAELCIGILYEFPCAVNVLKLNVKPACVAFGNKAFDGNRACVRIGAFAVLKGEGENLSQTHLVGVVIGLVKIAVALCDIALGNKILIAELNKVRSAVCAVLCEIGGNFGRELVKAPALDEES